MKAFARLVPLLGCALEVAKLIVKFFQKRSGERGGDSLKKFLFESVMTSASQLHQFAELSIPV